VEIATCSHVGHVFRKSTPYTFPGGTSKIVNHNNARLAEVWMDEWKDFYYNINPGQPLVPITISRDLASGIFELFVHILRISFAFLSLLFTHSLGR